MENEIMAAFFIVAVSVANYIGYKKQMGAISLTAIVFLIFYLVLMLGSVAENFVPFIILATVVNVLFFVLYMMKK